MEIKCPISAYKIGISQAIEQNKIDIFKYDKKTKKHTINKKSNWYHQIQGQLHITDRKKCLLGIWVGENNPLHIEYIDRDDHFWTGMEKKIVNFYKKCLLPELVNSRYERGMPIRHIILDDKENNQPDTPELIYTQTDLQQPGPNTGPSMRVLDINEF